MNNGGYYIFPGATLGKGVNRAIATFLGGGLGVAAHRLASFAGEKAEGIILGCAVFFIGKTNKPHELSYRTHRYSE